MNASVMILAASVLLAAAGPALAGNADAAIGDLITREIQKCWSPPPSSASHVVTVKFRLNRDGSLDGEPAVAAVKPEGASPATVAAAVRAVLRCTPIALPAEAYESWREIAINFDDSLLADRRGASTSPQ